MKRSLFLGVSALAAALLVWLVYDPLAGASNVERSLPAAEHQAGRAQAQEGELQAAARVDESGREAVAGAVDEPPDEGIETWQYADPPAREARLRVAVHSLQTGKPVVGVRVQLERVEQPGDRDEDGEIPYVLRRKPRPVKGWRADALGIPRANQQGVVEFELPAGTQFTLRVRDPLMDMERVSRPVPPLEVDEVREIALTLSTRYDMPFHGRVVALEDGAPIPNARVKMLDRKIQPGSRGTSLGRHTYFELQADALGTFDFRVASWKVTKGYAVADGFAKVHFETGQEGTSPLEPFVVRLPKVAGLTVAVKGDDDGPLANVDVHLRVSRGNVGSAAQKALEWRERTGADGTCTFEELVPDVPIDVRLSGQRMHLRPREPLRIAAGAENRAEYVLSRGVRVFGTLVDSGGVPVADCVIALVAASDDEPRYWTRMPSSVTSLELTDGSGAFTFDAVKAGAWWIGPMPQQPNGVSPHAEAVRIDPRLGDHRIELVADRGLFVRGRVLGFDVEDRATVHGVGVDSGVRARTAVNEDGTFALGPLRGEPIEVRARSARGDSAALVVEAGTEGVLLELRPTGQLTVDVRAGGGVSPASTISVLDTSGGVVMRGGTRPGQAFVARLPDGDYRVVARTAGGSFGSTAATVVAGADQDIVVPVQAGATLRLRGPDQEETGFALVVDGHVLDTGSIPAGGDLLRPVPAGDVTVRTLVAGEVIRERVVRGEVGGLREVVL